MRSHQSYSHCTWVSWSASRGTWPDGTRHHLARMTWSIGNLRHTSASGLDRVEPGVRHEDHVGVGAGGDGGQRAARPGRQQVGHVPGAGGQVAAARGFQPPDAAAPAPGRPVAALGEDDQRAGRVKPAGQALDLVGEDALAQTGGRG